MGINITFHQTDPSAKLDSTVTASEKQPWVDMAALSRDDVTLLPAMTLEFNRNLLDGTLSEFPVSPASRELGYWSDAMSDSDGTLENAPSIDITFGSPHKSLGLAILFDKWTNDFASLVRVQWFGEDLTTVLHEDTYALTSPTSSIIQTVIGYQRIVVTFLRTKNPRRYVKLESVLYGVIRELQDQDIDTVNILESVTPIGDMLSVNTLKFSLRTHTPEFSLIDPRGELDMLFKLQRITVAKNGASFGTFFLDTWTDVYNNENVFAFTAKSAVGVLDGYTFNGDIYTAAFVSDIVNEISDLCFPTGISRIVLDDSLKSARINGHIPRCTAREALQRVCFAIGAMVDESRSNDIRVTQYDIPAATDATISSEDAKGFSALADLIQPSRPVPRIATLEPNKTILDGSVSEFPVRPQTLGLGYWSETMSDPNGNFAVAPSITIRFARLRRHTPFVLVFADSGNDYASSLRVTWMRGDEVIYQQPYDNASGMFGISESTGEHDGIVIHFLRTSNPYRFVRLHGISFGATGIIPLDKQYLGGSVSPNVYYSGVEIPIASFVKNNDVSEIQNGLLLTGIYVFYPTAPMHSYSVTGGTILASSANSVAVNVAARTEVRVTGKGYTKRVTRLHANRAVQIGYQERICRFDGCDISDVAETDIAENILAYITQKVGLISSVRLDALRVGQLTQVDTNASPVIGTIEQLDINLRSGAANMKVVGSIGMG